MPAPDHSTYVSLRPDVDDVDAALSRSTCIQLMSPVPARSLSTSSKYLVFGSNFRAMSCDDINASNDLRVSILNTSLNHENKMKLKGACLHVFLHGRLFGHLKASLYHISTQTGGGKKL